MKYLFVCLIYSMFLMHSASAEGDKVQSKNKTDRIVMASGEIKEGTILTINEASLEFIHTGESLKYMLQKKDVSKIEFSSGRIETYQGVHDKDTTSIQLTDHHNKIAILPVIYVKDGAQMHDDVMEEKTQLMIYQDLAPHLTIMKVLDPGTTNAVLKKAGVSLTNLGTLSLPEIANLLGVEYLIKTILTINHKSTTAYSSSYGTVQSKEKKTNIFSSSASTSVANYQTNVDMMVYNDHGDMTFTKSKISFFDSEDAYPLTLKYLVKRLPFYIK